MPQTSLNGAQPAGSARFRLTRWREGYDIDDVDALAARIDSGTATSADISNARFRPVRLRPGYEMNAVDRYLAAVEEQLRAAGR